jgi:hypothetical protein
LKSFFMCIGDLARMPIAAPVSRLRATGDRAR